MNGYNWMDAFWSVAISPDGHQVLAGHGRGTILRWDMETGEPLPPFKFRGGVVMALAISPDGRWLASSGLNRVIYVWSLISGELVHTITTGLAGQWVTCIEFSPDSAQLAGGSGHLTFLDSPGGLALWDVASEQQLWSTPATPVSVRDLTFSPDGAMIASALSDGRILLHDAQKGRELASFAAHAGNANAAVFTPDARRLITGGVDGIKIWDTEDWTEVFAYADQAVACLALGDGGQKLVFGGFYPMASVLDSASPRK